MSILDGIELSNSKPSLPEIKTLLSLNFRIAIYVRAIGNTSTPGVGEEIVYHFVRDRKNDEGDGNKSQGEMMINCVLCKSKIGDSLKIFGITRPFTEFSLIFQNANLTGNRILYFTKYRVSIFPYDWYPCFEKDDENDPRWVEIRNTLPNLLELSREMENAENIQKYQERKKKEEEKREQEKKERNRIEEADRKREESRRRMEELAKTLIDASIKEIKDDNPDTFAANLAKTLKK